MAISELIYLFLGCGIGWGVAVVMTVLWLDRKEFFDEERET